MSKQLEIAVEKIRRLPEDRQNYAASILEDIATETESPYLLSDDERSAIGEGLADLDAGRIVPDEEMQAFWKRHAK